MANASPLDYNTDNKFGLENDMEQLTRLQEKALMEAHNNM